MSLNICPHCGEWLRTPSQDGTHGGIACCVRCDRLFDDGPDNRLLAACWHCRKHDLTDAAFVSNLYRLDDQSTAFVQREVIDGSRSHDDVIRLLRVGRQAARRVTIVSYGGFELA